MNSHSNLFIPTPKRSMADNVTKQIRQAILKGKLSPGEHLREERLAQMLAVSRGPVREALMRLERETLVVKEPNRGVFVNQLSREDVDEVYTLRLALEKLAVQMAIKDPQVEYLDEMQKIIDQMYKKTLKGISPHEAAELNMYFHENLCLASGHQRLHTSWVTLRYQIYHFLLIRSEANLEWLKTFDEVHQELLDAVRNKDESYALDYLEKHFRVAYEVVVAYYDDQL